MIEFDNNGYVKPYTIIEINIDDLGSYTFERMVLCILLGIS